MKPERSDWLLAGTLAAALLIQLGLHDHEGSLALNVVSGLLLTLPLGFRQRAPLAVIAIFAAVAVANEALGGALFTFPENGAPEQDPPLFASLAAGIVAFYSLGAHLEDRRAIAGGLIGLAGLWLTVFVSDQTDVAAFIWSGGLVAATPWFAGRVSRSRRLRISSLEREQEQRTQIALGEERARIARELHDVVAHSVGVIVVQAQGARRVIDSDPGRAGEALATIEDTARTTLGEMRRSLGVLRSENEEAARAPQPGVGDIDELLESARSSGLSVDFAVEGAARPLPQSVDLAAYRIVQEGLTNTIKHAGPVGTRVTLRYGDDELLIEVDDDGPGPADGAKDTAGHGLVGMRERVAAHGGDLHAGAGPDGGFLIRASLPLDR
ncbi:MAG: sensor histidine kinase [Solirubrobacterales bacterium]